MVGVAILLMVFRLICMKFWLSITVLRGIGLNFFFIPDISRYA